jgi:S-sulfo-L-cysteine synthase (O-acetyl-L-serine-dependent)
MARIGLGNAGYDLVAPAPRAVGGTRIRCRDRLGRLSRYYYGRRAHGTNFRTPRGSTDPFAVTRSRMMIAMSWDSRIERQLECYPALRAIGHTPLVPVHIFREELPEVEVLAKMECLNPGGSLKDRPVLRMVLNALDDGRLQAGKTILDSSSGNAGIAYAMVGRIIGVPVEIVIPDNASVERKRRMRAHGAWLTVTDPLLGYDEALREVHRRAKANPDRYFFCDQYSNDDNWRAHYETTAEEILSQTEGRLTHVVAGVGTGGTITGLGRRLKEHDPQIRVVCIVPEAFPGVEGLKPLGRSEDIVPAILDQGVIDERVSISVDETYTMCQRLAAAGFFVGQSSGAYLAGVQQVARRQRRGRFVTLFNDIGERYFSTRLWD